MASKTAAKTGETVRAGYRYIRAPLARNNAQPLIIGVNGVNTAIPQDGEMHLVRDAVAYEYERSLRAQRAFYDTQDRLVKESKIV